MNMWAAIVIIVLIFAVSGALGRRKRSQEEIDQRAEELPSSREKELESEVTELRERIHVLERIATDRHSSEAVTSRQLSEEIEQLRAEQDEAQPQDKG